ncbi:MAG: response regulator [Thermodesulfobacteriota bacterium]
MRKSKICIIDRDLANRGYLRECLEKLGHYVSTLDNALQIKDFLSKEDFDIVILSTETPGVRERNLLLEIKKATRPRILLIVSERGDSFLKEAIDLGVYGFIHKPFKVDEVCTMVNHLTKQLK